MQYLKQISEQISKNLKLKLNDQEIQKRVKFITPTDIFFHFIKIRLKVLKFL